MSKVRFMVQLPPPDLAKLRCLSAVNGVSVGELVRRAVAEWLIKNSAGVPTLREPQPHVFKEEHPGQR